MRTFHDCIQRSNEWRELRRGRFTSSSGGDFLIPKFSMTKADICAELHALRIEWSKKDKLPDLMARLPAGFIDVHKSYGVVAERAIDAAIDEKLAELMGCEIVEPILPWWVKRGNELEPVAKMAFEEATGLEIEEVGFVSLDGYYIGDSPDGMLLEREECLECKIPLDKTQIKYLREGVVPDDYRYQIAHHMAVTGAKACHFWSWSPVAKIPPLHIRVKRDKYVDDVLDGLRMVSDRMGKQLDWFQGLYSEYVEDKVARKAEA